MGSISSRMGVAPTGRLISIDIIDIIRVRDGRYVEHWGRNTLPAVLLRNCEPRSNQQAKCPLLPAAAIDPQYIAVRNWSGAGIGLCEVIAGLLTVSAQARKTAFESPVRARRQQQRV